MFGSVTPTVSSLATICGAVHVAPPSVDFTKATLYGREFGGWIRSKKSYRAPVLRSTTIWLPIVWRCWPVATITRGVLHVLPPSIVLLTIAGPVKADVWWLAFGLPFGVSRRSHTAYAVPAWTGSTVIDSLSLKNWKLGALSAISTRRRFQVCPPSVDVAVGDGVRVVRLVERDRDRVRPAVGSDRDPRVGGTLVGEASGSADGEREGRLTPGRAAVGRVAGDEAAGASVRPAVLLPGADHVREFAGETAT